MFGFGRGGSHWEHACPKAGKMPVAPRCYTTAVVSENDVAVIRHTRAIERAGGHDKGWTERPVDGKEQRSACREAWGVI